MINSNISILLKECRLNKGFSKLAVANMSNISSTTYRQIEDGTVRNPGVKHVITIFKALGIDLDEIQFYN